MAPKTNRKFKNIGERIRFIRGTLTRPEFGKKIGAYRNTILNWENNISTLECPFQMGANSETYTRDQDDIILKLDARLSAIEKNVAKLAKRKSFFD